MAIAGEASGDLHGSGVIRELKRRNPSAEIYGIGGNRMQAEGMQLIFHVKELAVMGFVEVLKRLPLLRSVERTLTQVVKARRPDVLLLIDYPGFNLRFAKTARSLGIRIVYYISPQVWAWHAGRLKKMRGLIDKMLVVFQFEEDLYRREGIEVAFVGHPLLEVLTEGQDRTGFCTRYGIGTGKPILALFPGSRRQEIEEIFPAMIGAARMLQKQLGVEVVVGAASALDYDYLKSFVMGDFPIRLVQNATYDIMANADLALVTSGTATLETACYRTPMIVVYKTSWPTYLIGRLLVRISNIGLVNIVAGKTVVPELLQGAVTPHRLAREAARMLQDEKLLASIREELAVVRQRLGTPGASARVAETILSFA
jgi:lipid-A-disaccharide synthase